MGLQKQFKKLIQILRRYIHKPHTPISKVAIIRYSALIVILTLAFVARINPYFFYESILKAFDPWYQYRVTQYVIEHGIEAWFTWHDDMSWYPYGRDVAKTTYPGVPFTAAFFYYLFQYLGIHMDLLLVAYFLPAIMGTLTTFVMYFLGKEIGGKRTGLFAAFFVAISPGYIQRTLVGFFDNECVGIFAMLLTYLFFIRALKQGSIFYGILAGMSLGYLCASWGASIYVVNLIPLTAFVLVLLRRYSQRLLISYTTTMTIGLFCAILVPRNGVKVITSSFGLPALFVFSLLILLELAPFLKSISLRFIDLLSFIYERLPEQIFTFKRYILLVMLIIALTATGYAYASGLFTMEMSGELQTYILKNIGGKFWTILNPIYREQERILASVGEHLPTPWGSFYYNLHLLTLFFPLGIYFLFKRGKDEDILLILFGLTAVYFAGSMIRIILILAPAAALLGAYGLVIILQPLGRLLRYKPTIVARRRKRIGYAINKEFIVMIFIAMFVLLSLQVSHNTSAAMMFGPPEMAPHQTLRDWPEALEYINMYLPENAIIASWWDYGYWITTVGNRTTVVDNATLNSTQIALIGYMFMAPNETESLRILKKFNATHVLVHFGLLDQRFGGDEFKWIWMARIATDRLGHDIINDSLYYVEGDKEPIKDLFFNSTIFKLLMYQEPGGRAAGNVQQNLQERFPTWQSHLPVTLKFFEVEYFSQTHLVKLYKINWDAWYAYVEANNISTTWP